MLIDNPRALLESLRYDVDQCIVNPFGERVWLKACVVNGSASVSRTVA